MPEGTAEIMIDKLNHSVREVDNDGVILREGATPKYQYQMSGIGNWIPLD